MPTNEGADPGEAGVWLEGVVSLGFTPRFPPLQTNGGVEKAGLKGLKASGREDEITEEASTMNTGLHLKWMTYFCDRHECLGLATVIGDMFHHRRGHQ